MSKVYILTFSSTPASNTNASFVYDLPFSTDLSVIVSKLFYLYYLDHSQIELLISGYWMSVGLIHKFSFFFLSFH